MNLDQFNRRNLERNFGGLTPRTWDEATNGGYLYSDEFEDHEERIMRRVKMALFVIAAVFALVMVFR
jgi:hypothetical protein